MKIESMQLSDMDLGTVFEYGGELYVRGRKYPHPSTQYKCCRLDMPFFTSRHNNKKVPVLFDTKDLTNYILKRYKESA